jgi:hypothetical protein
MARKYKYTDYKTGKVLFEDTFPNHVSEQEVNMIFQRKTGRNFVLEKAVIDREIRMIAD